MNMPAAIVKIHRCIWGLRNEMLAPMNIPTTAVSADMKLRAAAVFIDKPALRSTAKSPVIDEIGHFNTGPYKHNNHCHQCRYEVKGCCCLH